MQLASRKEKILAAVVESYILNGEPVGSKVLQADFELKVSSATIRNELAELTLHGLLIQPHTSAGRIPTDAGYRYYIDNLMQKKHLADSAKERLDGKMNTGSESPEKILETASKLISDLTGMTAVFTTPDGRGARVHKVRFVSVGRHTAMAVLITSTGMVKTGLFRCEFVITPEMLAVFDKAINEKLAGCPLIELTQPFIQTLAASFGELTLFMPNVLEAIRELANSALVSRVEVIGKMNLLSKPDPGVENGIRILRFLNTTQIARLLAEKCQTTGVLVGSETGIPELRSVSLIMSPYEISGQRAGAIAAIGPKRMDYSARLAVLEYITHLCSKLINEIVAEN